MPGLLPACGGVDADVDTEAAAAGLWLAAAPLGVADGEPDWVVFREWQAVASPMTAIAMTAGAMREVMPIDLYALSSLRNY
ncbi:MAG: hypothetical protein JO345_05845 [Streptosporangiaceae bacterium]|nr:hypothetical protein [Streptosporangiaceae bacterium]